MIWQLVWCVVGISVGGLCTYSSLASWKLCDPGVALRHWQHAQQACPPGFMPPASHSHLFVPRESFVYWFYWEVQLWKCALWFIKYPVIDVITAVIEILEPGPGSLEFSWLPPLISKTQLSNVTAVCFEFFFFFLIGWNLSLSKQEHLVIYSKDCTSGFVHFIPLTTHYLNCRSQITILQTMLL